MAKKSNYFSKEAWLIKHLRRISGMWPPKNEALVKAREKIQIGFYKNGNPEYKTVFRCYVCQEVFPRENIQVDHIIPCIDLSGFKDWNTYIEQLFCDSNNLGAICIPCHKAKNAREMEERRKIKKKAKITKKVKKDDNLY